MIGLTNPEMMNAQIGIAIIIVVYLLYLKMRLRTLLKSKGE